MQIKLYSFLQLLRIPDPLQIPSYTVIDLSMVGNKTQSVEITGSLERLIIDLMSLAGWHVVVATLLKCPNEGNCIMHHFIALWGLGNHRGCDI